MSLDKLLVHGVVPHIDSFLKLVVEFERTVLGSLLILLEKCPRLLAPFHDRGSKTDQGEAARLLVFQAKAHQRTRD